MDSRVRKFLFLFLLFTQLHCRADMATNYPPDGYYEILGTTWGTDVDRDESIIDAGLYSIKFAYGSSGKGLYLETRSASPDTAYSLRFRSRCSIASTAYTIINFKFFNASMTYISDSQSIFYPTAVGVWEWFRADSISPSGTAFVVVEMVAYATSAVMWYSAAVFSECGINFTAVNSTSAQAIANTPTKIQLPDDVGGGASRTAWDNVNDKHIVLKNAQYHFSWVVEVDNVDANALVLSYLYANSSEIIRGSRNTNGSSASDLSTVGSCDVVLSVGDVIEFYAVQMSATSKNTNPSAAKVRLSMVEIYP